MRSYDAAVAGRGVLTASFRYVVPATRVSAALKPMLAAEGFRGVVVAVHRSAFNAVGSDGRLITVASDSVGGMPDGLNVGPSFAPLELGISAGMTVWADAQALVVGTVLRVQLTGAETWSPEVRPIPIAVPGLESRRAVLGPAVAALRSGLGGGLNPALWGTLGARSVNVLAGTLPGSASPMEIARAGAPLIGLGPGLTPSGDDVLVGVAAALFALADGRAGQIAAIWADLAGTRTTPLAASFHRHAADGEFHERLHILLAAVLAGPTSDIGDAIRRAAAWGSTSGADTLVGVAAALDGAAVAGGRSAFADRRHAA
jgi:hypothetical protein